MAWGVEGKEKWHDFPPPTANGIGGMEGKNGVLIFFSASSVSVSYILDFTMAMCVHIRSSLLTCVPFPLGVTVDFFFSFFCTITHISEGNDRIGG